MSEEEQPPQETGKLVTQLASDKNHLGQGLHDMRVLSIIDKKLILPLTYLLISGQEDAGDADLADHLLHLYVSVGGRGRRDVIQGEGVMKGAQPNIEPEIERPNILARHTYARDKEREWKEQHGVE